MSGMMSGMIIGMLAFIFATLGFAYILWILSAKESGMIKVLGQIIAVVLAVLALIMLLYGGMGGMKGKHPCGMMGKKMMDKGMMDMEKEMPKHMHK